MHFIFDLNSSRLPDSAYYQIRDSVTLIIPNGAFHLLLPKYGGLSLLTLTSPLLFSVENQSGTRRGCIRTKYFGTSELDQSSTRFAKAFSTANPLPQLHIYIPS